MPYVTCSWVAIITHSYLVYSNVTYKLLHAQASKFDKKLFPAWSAKEENEILHQFSHGDGPDREDVKMLQLALMRLKQDGDELVQDVHWAHYPSDILLHNN